jgi:opacity protein-like surface antigen
MNMRPLLLILIHTAIYAQTLTPEVFATLGHGRLFRFEDNPIGGGPNLGAGIGLTHRSGLGVDLELNRTLGLTAGPVPCGIVGLACEGSARQGVTGASILSANVRYGLGRARVRPYVTGGVGALRSKGYASIIYAREQRAVLREETWSDTGLAVNFGGGLRIRLTRSLSLRPELRLYTASALSRANLSLFRPSLALAWAW